MYVQELRIESFRHLRNLNFGPFRRPVNPSELIILAGPNGGGKSSVLELLSKALTANFGWQYWTNRSSATEAYALRIGLDDNEVEELIAVDSTGRLADDPKGHAAFAQYLRVARGFWIESNVSVLAGNDANENNRARQLCNSVYANDQRKLGFFIRSERVFRPRGYNYQSMINRASKLAPGHFKTFSFQTTENQYNEIYEFLIEQSYDYTYKLGQYQKSILKGEAAILPSDPIKEYNDLLGRILRGYSFVDVEENNLTLRIRLPTGNEIGFDELSSGEKEAFFILALFVRQSLNNSIVVIDEPDLHLHPELARKMLRAMRAIQPQNQIWCASHSAEVIDEAGRERTYFLRASPDRTSVECTPATAENAELNILRDMYGYSGYVGISKKIVFTEGVESSADRKTFVNLFGRMADEIKIIPAGSCQELYRVNAAVLALLQSDFARCEFYLIRDRDFLSAAAVAKHQSHAPGRLFVLSRYHIENYLLDEDCISSVLRSLYQIDMSPSDVRAELINIASNMSASVLRDLAVSRLNELYQAEDCSVGKHSQNLSIKSATGVAADVLGPLKSVILANIATINSEITSRTDAAQANAIFEAAVTEVTSALNSDNWKVLFPGKRILQEFSKRNGLGDWPILQNLIIEQMAKSPSSIPAELTSIFQAISPQQ